MALPGKKRVAAILAIDMAGFSAQAEMDAAAAASAVNGLQARVRAVAAAHDGRVFSTAGDGFMCEFAAASEAVAAALDILTEAPADAPPARIGVHLGEVFEQESGDLLGHGVNVAARLEQLAAPGTALMSAAAAATVQGELRHKLVSQGRVALDKLDETIEAFVLDPAAKGGRVRKPRRKRAMLIVGALAASAIVVAGGGALWSTGIIGPSQEQRMQAALESPEARAAVTRALIQQLTGEGGDAPSEGALTAISYLQDSTLAEDQRAFSLLRSGERERAVRTLEDYGLRRQQAGDVVEAERAFLRASFLAQFIDNESALRLSRRAFATNPASVLAFERVAISTARTEGYPAGQTYAARTAETAAGPVAVYAQLMNAYLLVSISRLEAARQAWQAARPGVSRHRDNLMIQQMDTQTLAYIASAEGNLAEAQRAIAESRAIARRMPGEGWRGELAEVGVLFALGDYEGVWRATTEYLAMREARGWPGSHNHLVNACYAGLMTNRVAEAAPYCRAAGRITSDPIYAQQVKATFAMAEGRLDDARREIDAIALVPQITFMPSDQAILASLEAEYAVRSRDFSGADRHFENAVRLTRELMPSSLSDTFRVMGAAELQVGRTAQGCAHLAEALREYRAISAEPGIREVGALMRTSGCPA